MEAFIISNREWPADVQLSMGIHSIGKTMTEAWARHIGKRPDHIDFPAFVQRWSDKGYGPIRVILAHAPKDTE